MYILASVGFLLSVYALWVKHQTVKKEYKPLCDLAKNVSCSKALTSKFSALFGFHNAWLGIVFYAGVTLLGYFKFLNLVLFFSALSVLASLCLAAILIKQRNACVVCIATYIVNLLLLLTLLIK